jgi:hypothetical protein
MVGFCINRIKIIRKQNHYSSNHFDELNPASFLILFPPHLGPGINDIIRRERRQRVIRTGM